MFKQCISIGCTVRTHFYYVPVLFYVHIPTVFQHLHACISTMFKHFLCAFLLFPSTFFRAHPYCIPALPARISTMIQHFSVCITLGWSGWSGSFLGWSDYAPALLCVHFYFAPAFFCVYFHCDPTLFLCVYFYCAPAFFVHAFLLCFSSDTLPTPVLMLFTAWKRHGITMLSLLP